MNRQTRAWIDRAGELGCSLGFGLHFECTVHPNKNAYSPCSDLIWTLDLTKDQLRAIANISAKIPLVKGSQLPVVAWEVEGSDVSTKTMQADLANLKVTGAPFGILAVTGGTKDNLYERAKRIAKSMDFYFGNHSELPIDVNWLQDLKPEQGWDQLGHLTAKFATGSGGEVQEVKKIRQTLRKIGEDGGFVVHESFSKPISSLEGITKSEIDLVWMLPMPMGLAHLFRKFARFDDSLSDRLELMSKSAGSIVVVAFEIERSSGKHSYGGLLNLASHGITGAYVGCNDDSVKRAEAALATYSCHYPLSRISLLDSRDVEKKMHYR